MVVLSMDYSEYLKKIDDAGYSVRSVVTRLIERWPDDKKRILSAYASWVKLWHLREKVRINENKKRTS